MALAGGAGRSLSSGAHWVSPALGPNRGTDHDVRVRQRANPTRVGIRRGGTAQAPSMQAAARRPETPGTGGLFRPKVLKLNDQVSRLGHQRQFHLDETGEHLHFRIRRPGQRLPVGVQVPFMERISAHKGPWPCSPRRHRCACWPAAMNGTRRIGQRSSLSSTAEVSIRPRPGRRRSAPPRREDAVSSPSRPPSAADEAPHRRLLLAQQAPSIARSVCSVAVANWARIRSILTLHTHRSRLNAPKVGTAPGHRRFAIRTRSFRRMVQPDRLHRRQVAYLNPAAWRSGGSRRQSLIR